MEKRFYTSERNVQIVLALLKENNIKKIIASPGTTNFTFVASIQNDPYFEVYSAVDERSAAYMACGMAAESKEPVVLTCTGATASRDYYPGLTEAFYRKLPVLAITSHQGTDRIGQLWPQNIDRRQIPHDIANLSVELPVIKDSRDEAFVVMEANKAILELSHNGGGPVHINLFTTYSKDFSIKELPEIRVMKRFHAWDKLPELPKGKIAVYVASHTDFTPEQVTAIDRFCSTYDAIVICDHTSGYYGRYRLLPTLMQLQTYASQPIGEIDLLIHIGEVSAATFAGSFKNKQTWRVNQDGELRDPWKKLTYVFQMSEDFFFNYYGRDGQKHHEWIDACRDNYRKVYDFIPEIPFSNIWAAHQITTQMPKGALLHISASNTRRAWNQFPLPEGVTSACNVGCCGIDGCTSTFFGASLVNPKRLSFMVSGDLAFFYDLNALFNRHVGNNMRILLINNGSGAEFQLYHHFVHISIGNEDARKYIAAGGHNGKKSPTLVKHLAEDLGFDYLSAKNKEEFKSVLPTFVDPKIGPKPIIFEVFTTPEDESDALQQMSSIFSDSEGLLKEKIYLGIKKVAGDEGINKFKKLFKK